MDGDSEQPRELPVREIDVTTDTRDILAHARAQAEARNLDDYYIVDVDSHHVETESWDQIVEYIEDPVHRHTAVSRAARGGSPAFINGEPGLRYQAVGERIPHQLGLREPVAETDVHRDVVLARRAYQSFGFDVMVLFPTPMLSLGQHPQIEMETLLGRAYNKWLCERILPADERLKTMAFLPFNDPEAAYRTVTELADNPDVIGFMVTSMRTKPVHHNDYMKTYALLQEIGKPIGFHAGYDWYNGQASTLNRFISMHAVTFVFCNVIHMCNWVVNGLPERFPDLDVIWIESGLAWVPFLMQRLDNEYMMRTSEAPLLKRRPSEYMREMYYTSQPLEVTDMDLLKGTFRAVNAETQLLYSSDWPHWDFDVPATIFDLPFLDETAKRNILGENARRVFRLP
jgi:uncharacterized protein